MCHWSRAMCLFIGIPLLSVKKKTRRSNRRQSVESALEWKNERVKFVEKGGKKWIEYRVGKHVRSEADAEFLVSEARVAVFWQSIHVRIYGTHYINSAVTSSPRAAEWTIQPCPLVSQAALHFWKPFWLFAKTDSTARTKLHQSGTHLDLKISSEIEEESAYIRINGNSKVLTLQSWWNVASENPRKFSQSTCQRVHQIE